MEICPAGIGLPICRLAASAPKQPFGSTSLCSQICIEPETLEEGGHLSESHGRWNINYSYFNRAL